MRRVTRGHGARPAPETCQPVSTTPRTAAVAYQIHSRNPNTLTSPYVKLVYAFASLTSHSGSRHHAPCSINVTHINQSIDQVIKSKRTRPPLTSQHKKLSYRRGTARCAASVEILPVATQQCTNYLYDEVMKLEGYSGPMCNKHVHSTMTRSSRFRCPIGVINKPTTDELWISPAYRRLAVAKFSKSTM